MVVKVNDRGPFHPGRVIDLSYAAAVKLGYREKGTARVEVRALHPDEDPGTGTMLAMAGPSEIDTLVDGPPAPAPVKTPTDGGYRFDMHQNGKVMSADEFDAWMASRRVRVATGKPGKPGPSPARDAEPVVPAAAGAAPSPATTAVADGVTLQVASFADQQNAEKALALLRGASIGRAQLFDADVNGRRIWRLRIGPIAAASTPELAARVVGLGFGQPQRVRE